LFTLDLTSEGRDKSVQTCTCCRLQPCFHISDRPHTFARFHPFHCHRTVIELCRCAVGQQLRHIGNAIEHRLQLHHSHRAHGALHRAVAAGVKAQRRQQQMRLFDQRRVIAQLQQGIGKQILKPEIQIGEVLLLQTRHKQYKAGLIVAKQHAVAAVDGVKVGMPAPKRIGRLQGLRAHFGQLSRQLLRAVNNQPTNLLFLGLPLSPNQLNPRNKTRPLTL